MEILDAANAGSLMSVFGFEGEALQAFEIP